MLADVGRQLQVPQCVVVTALRPDVVLYSEYERTAYFTELTIPIEDALEEASERKELKYVDLVAGATRINGGLYIHFVQFLLPCC